MASLLMNTEDPEWQQGFGQVRRADMVCTCQGLSCSCIHENLTHSILEDEDEVSLSSTTQTGNFTRIAICLPMLPGYALGTWERIS